jgi:hypothetical protein
VELVDTNQGGESVKLVLKIALRRDGAINIAPPSHVAAATIDMVLNATAGVWKGNPVLTYRWQKSVDGVTWVDIDGGTALTSPPLTDFGYKIRLLEIPDGKRTSAVASDPTDRVAEQPSQSLSAERYVDGDMELAGVDNWFTFPFWGGILTKTTTNPHAGTRSLRIENDLPAPGTAYQNNIYTVGKWHQVSGAARTDAGTNGWFVADTNSGIAFIGEANVNWSSFTSLMKATSTAGRLALNSGTVGDATVFDSMSTQELTLNAQTDAPSADMSITWHFSPPVSPTTGAQFRGFLRINDFDAGNYWQVLYMWTGTQWDITLYSVELDSTNVRGYANNIGTVNAIRATASGNLWLLETSDDDGDTWASRATFSSAIHNTAVGVNATWTDEFTAGRYSYDAPT